MVVLFCCIVNYLALKTFGQLRCVNWGLKGERNTHVKTFHEVYFRELFMCSVYY